MPPVNSNITVAVTVYNRLDYIEQAINSALNQTVPVKVMVVEDCGPNEKLREHVIRKFGDRIEYHRNAKRRGLFDNWNACIELCRTDWLCILHDDDYLEPCFAETMFDLMQQAPDRSFYYGGYNIVDEQGRVLVMAGKSKSTTWHTTDVEQMALVNPVGFPAQLISVRCAKELGGFRPDSLYCGDWEFWFKLASRFGAAYTDKIIANNRDHERLPRATPAIDRAGKRYALMYVQLKRNVHHLRNQGKTLPIDRRLVQSMAPVTATYLLKNAKSFSRRILRYHITLFLAAKAMTWKGIILQRLALIFGPTGIRVLSNCYNSFRRH